jgi:putative inorganic carbon (hco3(-)) transporter
VSERLAFGFGTSGQRAEAPARAQGETLRLVRPPEAGAAAPAAVLPAGREQRDWAFVGLLAFTAMLYFRPQDTFPPLAMLRLTELTALIGLAGLFFGRLGRGQPITRLTPELMGVFAFGGVILLLAPFSIWMGGSIATFTDLYVKVMLIFLLMVNTLTTPRRVEQLMWLIVLAMAYISFRALFDYARGMNLIENGRVQGALGGMFRNPNDLALNLVVTLPLAVAIALRGRTAFRRLFALGGAALMVGAIVVTHSRSGSVGLAAMGVLLAALLVRRRPRLVLAGGLVLLLALPLTPASYWNRIASITDETQDDTGSREARSILMREAWAAFLAHPLTGIGAGQFRNYNPEGREEAWRETHNALLQVAAETGVFGFAIFSFLIVRGAMARRQTRRLLRRATGTSRGRPAAGAEALVIRDLVTGDEEETFDTYSMAAAAALGGWFVCAFFASVAYHWTFYYLLALAVAPREILRDRLAAALPARRASRAAEALPQAVRA